MSSRRDHKPYKTGKERERSRSPRERRSGGGGGGAATVVAAAAAVATAAEGGEQRRPENIALSARDRLKSMGNQMKLNSARLQATARPKLSVAAAFNQDSDDEPEEMPPEAKMRMRNIGRDTPTSSGPNSFGKTKQGFLDEKNVFDKKLRAAMDSYMQEPIKTKAIDKCEKK